MSLTRRAALIGGAAAAGGIAIAYRPTEANARAPYFAALDSALKEAGIVTPALVIDRDRLDANIDHLKTGLAPDMAYRAVAKSLPATPLLARIMDRADTDRLMTFNLPMLRQVARDLPEAHQMLGKPLTAASAKAWLSEPVSGARILWLIDSIGRLKDYGAIAAAAGQRIDVALELDVGLHRGGFTPGAEFRDALTTIAHHDHLRFGGLMGYEPHIPSVPTLLGWRDRALKSAWALYEDAKTHVRDVLGEDALTGAVLNAAGSPTYRLYADTNVANEVAAGSALLKPTDFDTPLLEGHQPAMFIATPMLKGPMPTRIPVLERLPVRPARAETIFIHGGHWMADPVDPAGLRYNDTFGRSSNQEMLNGAHIPLTPGDFVFLRPHQSEALMLQFGPLVVVSGGQVIEEWSTFEVSA